MTFDTQNLDAEQKLSGIRNGHFLTFTLIFNKTLGFSRIKELIHLTTTIEGFALTVKGKLRLIVCFSILFHLK